MSTSRHDPYYAGVERPRRSSPGGSQGGIYFQSGHSSFQSQGGRTVLPPLSSAFPTSHFPDPYPSSFSQPRSSPGRGDYNVSSLYAPWSSTTPPPLQPLSNAFPFFESHDARYPQQATYASSYSNRGATPTIPPDPHASRRLPPLTVLTTPERDVRWQSTPYPLQTGPHMPVMGTTIRSPTASYPPAYATYAQSDSYSYPAVHDMRDPHTVSCINHHQSQAMHIPASSQHGITPRSDGRPSSHSRSAYDPDPPTVTATEEPAIKKKRKRADANQLRVLNETYNRTAFPSTEERAELAKKLDMSARSVQIWFQNKRQSMRQQSRQSSSSNQSSNQPFSISPSSDILLEEVHAHPPISNYTASPMSMVDIDDSSFMSRSSHSSTRALVHSSQTPPPHHHRPRSREDSADLHKWSRGY